MLKPDISSSENASKSKGQEKESPVHWFYLTFAMIFAGSSVVIAKFLSDLPSFTVSFISFLLSSITLLPFLLKEKISVIGLFKKISLPLFLQTFLGAFVSRILTLYGAKYTSATEGGIIFSMGPAIVAILSYIILKERISFQKFSGILLVLSGILILNLLNANSQDGLASVSIIGNILIFGSVLSNSLLTIIARKLKESLSPIENTFLMSVISVLLFLPFTVYDFAGFGVIKPTVPALLGLVYYGVVVTGIAYLFWFKGLAKINASIAGVFMGIMPISSTFFSIIILGEKIRSQHIISLILVISGIFLVTLNIKVYAQKLKRTPALL